MKQREFDAETIYGEIVKAGDEWSDKDAAANLLEETKSSVFAHLFNEQDQKLPVSAREHLAKDDPAYRLHITKMVEARRVSNRAKVKFDSVKLLADLRRSEMATNRAMLRNSA